MERPRFDIVASGERMREIRRAEKYLCEAGHGVYGF